MSFMDIIWSQKAAILNSLQGAIVYGMLDTWSRCRQHGSTPEEPDYVAAIVLGSTPLIYENMKTILDPQGVSVSVASVFCHQTPQVAHELADKPCELGDLLFVHIHRQPDDKLRRNALLYQAKKSFKQSYKVPRDEQHQLSLYTNWPQFTYRSPSALAGQERNVSPNVPHTGAQYMLIDDRPLSDPYNGLLCSPGAYQIRSCMADRYLHPHNSLAQELFDLFRFRSGKSFEEQATAVSTDGWSQTIWDLMGIGIKKAFNRKNSGRSKSPRIAGGSINLADGAYFAATTGCAVTTTVAEVLGHKQTAEFFESPAYVPPAERISVDADGSSDSGVSIILIETSQVEQEE